MKKYTFLVVEDEYYTRDILTKVIDHDFPYSTIIGAENGEEALELLRKVHVDVCITDGMMPKINGFELLKSLKNDYPNIKILFITGCSQEFDKSNALAEGVDEYIEKPFDINTLGSKIKEVLNI